jgi:hypothetical protein
MILKAFKLLNIDSEGNITSILVGNTIVEDGKTKIIYREKLETTYEPIIKCVEYTEVYCHIPTSSGV